MNETWPCKENECSNFLKKKNIFKIKVHTRKTFFTSSFDVVLKIFMIKKSFKVIWKKDAIITKLFCYLIHWKLPIGDFFILIAVKQAQLNIYNMILITKHLKKLSKPSYWNPNPDTESRHTGTCLQIAFLRFIQQQQNHFVNKLFGVTNIGTYGISCVSQ